MEVPETQAPLVGAVGETLVAHDADAILGTISILKGKPTDEEIAVIAALVMRITQPTATAGPLHAGFSAWSMAAKGESQGKRPLRMSTDRRLHAYIQRKWYRDGRPSLPKQAQDTALPTSS